MNWTCSWTEPNRRYKCFHCSAYDGRGAARPIESTHKRIECEINERAASILQIIMYPMIIRSQSWTLQNAIRRSFNHILSFIPPVWSSCPLTPRLALCLAVACICAQFSWLANSICFTYVNIYVLIRFGCVCLCAHTWFRLFFSPMHT